MQIQYTCTEPSILAYLPCVNLLLACWTWSTLQILFWNNSPCFEHTTRQGFMLSTVAWDMLPCSGKQDVHILNVGWHIMYLCLSSFFIHPQYSFLAILECSGKQLSSNCYHQLQEERSSNVCLLILWAWVLQNLESQWNLIVENKWLLKFHFCHMNYNEAAHVVIDPQ